MLRDLLSETLGIFCFFSLQGCVSGWQFWQNLTDPFGLPFFSHYIFLMHFRNRFGWMLDYINLDPSCFWMLLFIVNIRKWQWRDSYQIAWGLATAYFIRIWFYVGKNIFTSNYFVGSTLNIPNNNLPCFLMQSFFSCWMHVRIFAGRWDIMVFSTT